MSFYYLQSITRNKTASCEQAHIDHKRVNVATKRGVRESGPPGSPENTRGRPGRIRSDYSSSATHFSVPTRDHEARPPPVRKSQHELEAHVTMWSTARYVAAAVQRCCRSLQKVRLDGMVHAAGTAASINIFTSDVVHRTRPAILPSRVQSYPKGNPSPIAQIGPVASCTVRLKS